MPPDLALLSTLIGLNYPCLELIFMVPTVPGRVAQSVGHLTRKGPGFDTRSGNILSFLLPLF